MINYIDYYYILAKGYDVQYIHTYNADHDWVWYRANSSGTSDVATESIIWISDKKGWEMTEVVSLLVLRLESYTSVGVGWYPPQH